MLKEICKAESPGSAGSWSAHAEKNKEKKSVQTQIIPVIEMTCFMQVARGYDAFGLFTMQMQALGY